jgi:hypothetical protein
MSRLNVIQNAIKELDGGSFQKLFDAYLYKKYQFKNIQPLGVQTGTNKTTKGTPDSFVNNEDGTFILIMYGSVSDDAFNKIKKDILSCFNQDKLVLADDKIDRIICAYTSTNIHVEQVVEIENMIDGTRIEMLGLGTLSHDLLINYPFLAAEFLNIPIDTDQIFDKEEFVKRYDKNGMNAPLNMNFLGREKELENLSSSISNSVVTLITGSSGTGKTKIALEVCEHFERVGWKVLCVKNNGELLYNDVRYFISDKGDYLLFIDDANQTTSLEYVMNFIANPPDEINIKVILTVRDYAKQRVKSVLCKYMIPTEVPIKSLKGEEIKHILINNLGIKNDDYLERITKIAKGNIRLAILAGKISIEKGYLAINNAMDIFKNYYGQIIDKQELNEEMVNSLFAISLLGPLRFKESKIAIQILDAVNINESSFIDICHDLNSKELIDMYQDEVVKVSDQSFGNYILEYVLIEKKNISICKLLKLGFPAYKNKLIYALNTLISIFNADNIKEYIERQVNESWDLAEPELHIDYLTSFHALNEEKSLSILKRRINEMEVFNEDLTEYDFDGKKNYNTIKTLDINILSGFKYSQYYSDVLELLFLLIDKRPDLVMDFYFALTDKLSYNKFSHQSDYCKEYELIECMWKHCEEGKNINFTILMLHVYEKFLHCAIDKTEEGENARTINLIRFNIILTEGSKKIRFLIWRALSILYKNELYREFIERILSVSHASGLQENECKEVIAYDYECIKQLFIDIWEEPTFEQCKVLYEIKKHLKRLDITYDASLCKYNKNKEFVIYKTLIKEHIKGNTWEEDEADRREEIEKLIKTFTIEDYKLMFKICKEQLVRKDKEWSLQSGMEIVFSILEEDVTKYINIINIYLENGAPCCSYPVKIIWFLVRNIGLKETERLIKTYDFVNKRIWECTFYQIIPEEEVNNDYVLKLLTFTRRELNNQEPIFPSVSCLEKYNCIDKSIVKSISEIIIKASNKTPFLATNFLERLVDDERINRLLNLYSENVDILENLYLIAMGDHFDYYGKLLQELANRNIDFWNKYTLKLSEHVKRTSHENKTFERIWKTENHSAYIAIACDNMIGDEYSLLVESEASVVFANSQNTSDEIKNRKKQWVINYIDLNYKNIDRMKMIFGIIADFFLGDRKDCILEFLKCSDDFDEFKKIPLFPSSNSWSGSEVPLIDKEIDFIKDLISELKGVTFIEHRAYLKETMNSYEKYKQSVLIKEYLEDLDLA